MANTYYNSQLTGAQIEQALEAINGVIIPANNGKVLAINNGKIEARSVQWGGGGAVVQPLSVTQNGTYNPPSGVDGYAPVTVNVSGGGGTNAELENVFYLPSAVSGEQTNTYTVQEEGVYLALSYIVNGEASTKTLTNTITTTGSEVAGEISEHTSWDNPVRNDSINAKIISCSIGDTITFNNNNGGGEYITLANAVYKVSGVNITGISTEYHSVTSDNNFSNPYTYSFTNIAYHLCIGISTRKSSTDKLSLQSFIVESAMENNDYRFWLNCNVANSKYMVMNCLLVGAETASVIVMRDTVSNYASHGFICFELSTST